MKFTQEQVREWFDYDPSGKLLWKVKASRKTLVGSPAGSKGTNGYTNVVVRHQQAYLHRLIWLWHYGTVPKVLDHIDGDPTNNRVENLRPATQQQNTFNSSTKRKNSELPRNVFWDKSKSKWTVALSRGGKTLLRKRFDDLELAELVAYEARLKFFGEFACHV